MSADVKKDITGYLAGHYELHLATVAPDGRPMVHTVTFVSDGAVTWCFTGPGTRKVRNIRSNPAVAYSVCDAASDWRTLKAVQMEGNAVLVDDRAEKERILGLFIKKFPPLAGMPMSPDAVAIFRIDPTTGYYLDYGVSFGYRAEAAY